MTIINSGFLMWYPLLTSRAWWPLSSAVLPLPFWNGQYQLLQHPFTWSSIPFPLGHDRYHTASCRRPALIYHDVFTVVMVAGSMKESKYTIHTFYLSSSTSVWSEPHLQCGHWSILVMVSMMSRCPAYNPPPSLLPPSSPLSPLSLPSSPPPPPPP